MPDERELVERFLRNRDEESFLLLYRLFTPLLYPLAVHLAGDASAAEEAVQELWVRVVRKLSDFRWESQLRTWLTGILIRCCAEKNRTGTRPYIEINEELEDPKSTFDPELRIDLQSALAMLPDRQRAVFLLHDLEGYTHEEIGALLGIESGTSKSQLFHARKLLRSYLSGGKHV
ncbi:RNA polymerase sigma factor [bacterium]|nr:RNA polymerase sigma factor [bacterium]MCI0602728.1 RNA polymerase sigma factor [bacterium]